MTIESIGDELIDAPPVGQSSSLLEVSPLLPPEKRDRFWPTLAGVGAVSVATYAICAARAQHSNFVGLFFDALAVGQISVIGMWLAMGKTPFAIRLMAAWAASAGMLVLWSFNSTFAEDLIGPILLLGVYIPVAATVTFGLRLAGACAVRYRSDDSYCASDGLGQRQFSLRQIFSMTTAVAIVAGLLRISALNPHDLLIWALILAISLTAAWAALSDFALAWVLALLVMPGISLALAPFVAGSWLGVVGTIVELGGVILTLLPFRLLGYRARFRADRRADLPSAMLARGFPEDARETPPPYAS